MSLNQMFPAPDPGSANVVIQKALPTATKEFQELVYKMLPFVVFRKFPVLKSDPYQTR